MHEMVPYYVTWFLREQSFCIIPHVVVPSTFKLMIQSCDRSIASQDPPLYYLLNHSLILLVRDYEYHNSEEILSLVSSWICLSVKLQKIAHPIRINMMNDMMP
ncbi:hypothetical protein BDL97_10G023900 [Sphagnum fallax]|nr:hypothetical protein BDL97_10G023900 [Sphagnum fallax]